ncbi:MAG TPA: SDR family oxidoreductase [Opitutaceae bacterium]|nr:SDR family oxidoreductase [Opitutaceae bacterium]
MWIDRTSMANSKATKPVILVTGASQGIGAAIARAFAREVRGARLALVARNGRRLEAVAKACAREGGAAAVFPCDVTNEGSVAAMAAAVQKRFGAIDVLVNNAGKFAGAPLTEMSVGAFDALIAANLRSVFLVSRALIPGMIRRGRGDIFNMSSIAGLSAYPGGAGYSAAKFGVSGLSKVMRAELRDKGVRVCCVYPGATWSPSWEGSGVAPERMMPAEDVAQAFVEIYRLSRRTVVEEIVLRPQAGDI